LDKVDGPRFTRGDFEMMGKRVHDVTPGLCFLCFVIKLQIIKFHYL
jgi:hypothetical protein